MRTEGAERNAGSGKQRAQSDEELGAQSAFFFFFSRCARVLP